MNRIDYLRIAIVALLAVLTVSGSCALDTRTNFCEQFGIRCNEGEQCALNQAACIEVGGCGDGTVDRNKGEMCDDGNVSDGEMVDGVMVLDACSHDCSST